MGSLGRENWLSLLVSGLGTWPERNKRTCSCSSRKRVSKCWLRVRHSIEPAEHARGIHQTSSRPQALPGAALACACYERLENLHWVVGPKTISVEVLGHSGHLP